MTDHRKSVCRLCRREGVKLFLKGDRCYTDKCAVNRRSYPPGEHGQGRGRRKVSEYGIQLREKQKARRMYGVSEGQFRSYFQRAERQKGVTGENLFQILESRLGNMVYRMGFASSRAGARQLIRHGHFTVNGRKVDIQSYLVKQGDIVAVKEKSKGMPLFKEIAENGGGRVTPDWLEIDRKSMSCRIVRLPSREEIEVPIAAHLIVEWYSR